MAAWWTRPAPYGTIGAFLKIARGGGHISLYGDGCQRRTVTHVADLVAQVIGLGEVEAAANGIFNVGGEAFSLKELAERIARRFGGGRRPPRLAGCRSAAGVWQYRVRRQKDQAGSVLSAPGLVRGLGGFDPVGINGQPSR